MTTIVLAGGKGLRLGQVKASLKIGRESLIQHVISRLIPLGTETMVVVSQGQSGFPRNLGVKIVTDVYAEKRALGGIYSGLAASTNFHNLVVACDMPFLNLALLRYMMALSSTFDIVIPRVGQYVEPLHAVYSKNCLEPIERMLKQGNLRVSGLLDLVKARYIEEAEIDKYDPEHLSFFNINSQADLERARRLKEVMAK